MPPSTSALQKRTATSGSSSATETTGLICGPTSSPRSCRPLCSCLALSINCVRRCLSLSRRCKALRVEAMIDGGRAAVNMYGRQDRKSVGQGKSVSVRGDPGGRLILTNKRNYYYIIAYTLL